MEYMGNMSGEPESLARILCCECGIAIEPNPANMCVGCLRTRVDITEGIPKQATIHFCKGCERYLKPPMEWVSCVLESRELLGLCLAKLKGLNKVKLIDAGFVWTEPHSKRIKVKLTVQGEALTNVFLQQVFVVEFTVASQMCDACHRTEAKDYWKCKVQVRQRSENKKTFFYLEQLILKHKAHENTLSIKPIHEGIDFFYATEAHARKMVDFLQAVLPVKTTSSKKLISHDIHSNTYNYKMTYSVEIVPLSKDSLVCLPKKLSHQLAGMSQLCLVARVTNAVHLIDPCSAQIAEVSGNVFWRSQFAAIANPKQLIQYTVMECEPILSHQQQVFPGQGPISNKHTLADVWVVRSSELGINNDTIHTRSHLGHLLKPGDTVLGYCLVDSNVNNSDFDNLKAEKVPDVVLVSKYYGDRTVRKHQREWKLRHLHDDVKSTNTDYMDFLDDLECDPAYRQNVNIYRKNVSLPPVEEVDEDDRPRISLQEMLEDLVLEDAEMEEVGNGDMDDDE
ncbi:60S ribosomal export protein NMD3 [Neocloeon triangulifer]|uniref:60S ribosomal export protein NMD3 n=1 Tax=Neocloeon triangulifer TaxID=2078957 RepID=UPI00286F96EB|nr:60S ribosomal export protein NMD3 [Neocloeon triangulifer]